MSLSSKSTERLDYLDSLRGIAALIVLIFHTNDFICNTVYRTEYNQSIVNILRCFFNGIDAVSFFFVLSGFVLSYSYFKSDKEFDYTNYVIKRFLRLFPLYLFVILFAVLFRYTNNEYNSIMSLLKELFLFNNHHPFLPHGWSLSIELVMSLILPFFFILLKQVNVKYIFPMLLVTLFSFAFISAFLFHFILGLFLALVYLNKISFSFKIKYLLFLFPLVLLIHNMRYIAILVPQTKLIFVYLGYLLGIKQELYFFYLSAISSSIIIIMAFKIEWFKKILNISPLRFLGKISYGVYLIHYVLILHVLKQFNYLWNVGDNVLTFILANCLLIIVTVTASTFTYYFIEQPFIALGKRWTTAKTLVPKLENIKN
jgi:peptidoglycan/LPS O-acetylase OafA/YrhL